MNKLIGLDLDGVIFKLVNHFGEYGVSARLEREIEIVDGLDDLLDALVDKGYVIVGITNQPDIARKKISPQFLNKKHKLLQRKYPQIKKIYICSHTETDLCSCRKPKPGLLLQADKDFKVDFSQSWVIGDSRPDIEAGTLVHAKTILIQTKYNCGDPSLAICTAVARNVEKSLRLVLDIENKKANLVDV